MSVERYNHGWLESGREINKLVLKNSSGMTLELSEFGAAILKILVPDRYGKLLDVVGGYDSFDGYMYGQQDHGVVVGRFANRIAKGKFTLDGKEYQLTINDRSNHLHGGRDGGLGRLAWNSEVLQDGEKTSVRFSCISPDGKNGYPGNLSVYVTYTLSEKNEIFIYYEAKTDKKQ